MNFLDRVKFARDVLFFRPSAKTIYNMTPVGVQGRPQRPDADIAGLMQAYKHSEIVFACINVKAQAAVDPRLIVEKRKQGDTWAEVEGHPMRRLMMRPNPYMDEAGFARAVLTSMDVAGVFYAEIVRASNRPGSLPVALYPLDPAKIRPIPNAEGGIGAYEWRDGSLVQVIQATEMLVWRNYDPQNRYQGLSPLSVALGSVAGDNMQTDYIRAFFDTGGIPSGILTLKDRTVDENEANILRAKWRQKFNPRFGGIKDDIAVLDMNAEFQVLGSRLDQLQNEEVRSVAESRICMVFNVPPLIVYAYVGLLRATYSNLKEAWANFWTSYLTPWFKQYRSWLTWSLLVQFEGEDLIYGERVRLAHDMRDVSALQDDVNAKHERARADLLSGGILINEYREMIGLEPDAVGGDVYLRSLSLVAVPWEKTAIAEPVPADPAADPAAAAADVPPAPAADPGKAAASPDETQPATGRNHPLAALAETHDLPKGFKRALWMKDGSSYFRKALADRERIADKNKTKIEKYLMAQYTLAAGAVRDHGKDWDEFSEAELKAARTLQQYVTDMLDDGEDAATATRPLYTASLKKSYEDGADLLEVDLSFDLENENVQLVLDELLKQVKSDVPQTTKDQIRSLIGMQASEGWSIDRLADEILAKGGIQSPYRARNIAHTESARAFTKGSLLSFTESGVVEETEWNSFIDTHTSDICIALNGKRAKLGELYDGQFDGPPGHPGGCRSALIPIVKG